MSPPPWQEAQHNPALLLAILHIIGTEGLRENLQESQVLGRGNCWCLACSCWVPDSSPWNAHHHCNNHSFSSFSRWPLPESPGCCRADWKVCWKVPWQLLGLTCWDIASSISPPCPPPGITIPHVWNPDALASFNEIWGAQGDGG